MAYEKEMAALASALSAAVERAVSGKRRVAISFSGGLDSSLLAYLAKGRCEVRLYTFGLENSEDLRFSRVAARELGMELEEIVADGKELLALLDEAKGITRETELMKLELSIPLLAVCRRAGEDGLRFILTGAGAEELFAGYERHRHSFLSGEDLRRLLESELAGLYEKDLRRSGLIAESCGLELVLPFLDQAVVDAARAIPPEMNFENGRKKAVLARAALLLGLPERIALRPKRAMQYGTGVHRALTRLAASALNKSPKK